MLKPLIRTIDRWRFELPLALALGAAAAFATIAAPHTLFDFGSTTTVTIVIQSALAGLFAVVATVIAYFAMRRPTDTELPEVFDYDEVSEFEASEPVAPADSLIRLRRADAHPDAPPRAPIRASRDLGAPLMEVDTTPRSRKHFSEPLANPEAVWHGAQQPAVENAAPELASHPEVIKGAMVVETAFVADPVAEHDPGAETSVDALDVEPEAADVAVVHELSVDEPVVHETIATEAAIEEPIVTAAVLTNDASTSVYLATEADEAAVVPEHVSNSIPETLPVAPLEAAADPIQAFEPEVEPAPATSRPGRVSLSSMMDRLSAGLEGRDGRPVTPPATAMRDRPYDPRPDLRNALEELNRLATRRD